MTRLVRAPNPGPMTLTGTNSWLLDDGIVIDPGPDDAGHLARLATARLILITHHHGDHTDGAARLHELTGAPARGLDPACCIDADPLHDGETIGDLAVLATPGHTADSVSFVRADAVFTGDTILGTGWTVVAAPDGDLAAYLDSLRRLQALGPRRVLPGHGPERLDLGAACAEYLEHRTHRLDQVRAALADLGPDATARQLVERIYADVDRALWPAAEQSTQAALDYLR